MLVPEHIAPLLVTAGLGKLGVDLFCHTLPAKVTRGMMVTGDLAGSDIDYELAGWRRGRMQVILRHPNHVEGMTAARKVMSALTLGDRSLPAAGGSSAVRLRLMRPVHDPIVYPRSEGDEIEFSMNFEIIWTSQ